MSNHLSCDNVQNLLPLYVEGLLTEETREEVRKHLAECAACSRIHRQMSVPEPVLEEEAPRVDYFKKVRNSRIKAILTALVSVVLIAAALLVAFKLKSDREAAELARSLAETPVVSYDEAARVLVITGTGNYDQSDLTGTPNNAASLEVQDDNFHLTADLHLLRTWEAAPLEMLPDYLERADRSLAFLRSYLVEHAPGTKAAEQAEKYVELSICSLHSASWRSEENRIVIELAHYYRHIDVLYALAMMNPGKVEWQHLAYAWNFSICLDENGWFRSNLNELDTEVSPQIPYAEAYLRAGGTKEPTAENVRLSNDAVAWYNLTNGMDWDGTATEIMPICDWDLYTGSKNAPGAKDMSLCMGISLLNYLSDRYGFDKVSTWCFGERSFEETFGVDYETARADWEQQLDSVFAVKPEVHYDEASRVLTVTGTENYRLLDLSGIPEDAGTIEIRDNDFQLTTDLGVLRDSWEDPLETLPRWLEQTDRSLAFLRQYLPEKAPGTKAAERAGIYVEMYKNNARYPRRDRSEDRAVFELGIYYQRMEVLWGLAVLDPQKVEWQHLAYAWDLAVCLDPEGWFRSNLDELDTEVRPDVPYVEAYLRAGGTKEPTEENLRLSNDAVAWYNLTHGMKWGGTSSEVRPIHQWDLYGGTSRTGGSSMSLCMGESLLNRLSDLYGFDKVTAWCCGELSFEEAFGCSYSTARAAWEQWLKETFQE